MPALQRHLLEFPLLPSGTRQDWVERLAPRTVRPTRADRARAIETDIPIFAELFAFIRSTRFLVVSSYHGLIAAYCV